LVRRPKLSSDNATKLARFVAVALVSELEQRADLDVETTAQLTEALERRIAEDPQAAAEAGLQPPEGEKNQAIDLHNRGQLSPEVMGEAIAAGRRAFVLAGLTMKPGLEEPVVHSLLNSKNAKAIVSLAWKSGLEMDLAQQLQLRLGGIRPASALNAKDDGSYPLSEGDMEWQIDLVAESESV
jgi:uncharacterized protein (DUF2336 family)